MIHCQNIEKMLRLRYEHVLDDDLQIGKIEEGDVGAANSGRCLKPFLSCAPWVCFCSQSDRTRRTLPIYRCRSDKTARSNRRCYVLPEKISISRR